MNNQKLKLAVITAAPIATMFLAHTASADETYTVQSGDSLSAIASKFNSNIDSIAKANNIHDINQIYSGQELTIPTDKKAEKNYTSTATAVTTYKATPAAPKTTSAPATGNTSSAKAWIAMKESTNNYNARNGRYIGKYQLDAAYLNGDFSPANQERVAENYVKSRYGSWEAAKAFHQANGWY